MGKNVLVWSIPKLVDLIVQFLENEYDFILCIDGVTGIGKSTVAYKIVSMVKRRLKKHFNPHKDIVFSREDVGKELAKRNNDGLIADEMINVTFNREFFLSEQIKIIKMLSMYRDHCNLFAFCVPSFYTLDKGMRELARMRITVVRRGFAVVQTKNKSLYSKDHWDSRYNEKLESKWGGRPRYSKLTTFRGILKFSDLTEKQKKEYKEIKDMKRAKLLEMETPKEVKTPFDRLYERMREGKVTEELMREFAILNGMRGDTLRRKLNERLKDDNIQSTVKDFISKHNNRIRTQQQKFQI